MGRWARTMHFMACIVLKDAGVQCRLGAFCHLGKPVALEIYSGIVYGGECPLGCVAVTACYFSCRGWTIFGWCFCSMVNFAILATQMRNKDEVDWSSPSSLHLCHCQVKLPCIWSLQIFQKSINHILILGVRRGTCSMLQAEDPEFWNDLWTSLLHGAFCSVRVNWKHIFLRQEQ